MPTAPSGSLSASPSSHPTPNTTPTMNSTSIRSDSRECERLWSRLNSLYESMSARVVLHKDSPPLLDKVTMGTKRLCQSNQLQHLQRQCQLRLTIKKRNQRKSETDQDSRFHLWTPILTCDLGSQKPADRLAKKIQKLSPHPNLVLK